MCPRRWNRRSRLIASLLILGSAASCSPDRGGTATRPVAVTEIESWMARHRANLERAARKDIDLLFLGDSLCENWKENAAWKRYYAPRKAANFGIGGDRTEHLLWQIDHGELDGIAPKAVVLLIGTNNLGWNSSDEIAEGVKAVIAGIRRKLPDARILLLGVFPRSAIRTPEFIRKHESADPDPRTRASMRNWRSWPTVARSGSSTWSGPSWTRTARSPGAPARLPPPFRRRLSGVGRGDGTHAFGDDEVARHATIGGDGPVLPERANTTWRC